MKWLEWIDEVKWFARRSVRKSSDLERKPFAALGQPETIEVTTSVGDMTNVLDLIKAMERLAEADEAKRRGGS